MKEFDFQVDNDMLEKLKEVPTVSKMRSALQYQHNKIRIFDKGTKDAVFGKPQVKLTNYKVEDNPSSGHKMVRALIN